MTEALFPLYTIFFSFILAWLAPIRLSHSSSYRRRRIMCVKLENRRERLVKMVRIRISYGFNSENVWSRLLLFFGENMEHTTIGGERRREEEASCKEELNV